MTLATLAVAGGLARITLNRPDRHNSLVPALLDDLNAALGALAGCDGISTVILQANGRSFSTGGDLKGFLEVPREQRAAYAQRLVRGLNRAILALYDLPVPLIGRVHGPVTGGAAGLMLACDLVALGPRAFLQPYYGPMGFGPDGGWTALLPHRIGARQASRLQLLNQRLSASDMLALGLADAIAETDADLDAILAKWIDQIGRAETGALRSAKQLVASPQRAGIAAALDAELHNFIRLIDRPETERRMLEFLPREGA